MSAESELAGRVALVTGASGGIGAAIARALASAGTTVGVGYGRGREAAERIVQEIVSGGGRAQAFGADLADSAAPGQLVDEVAAALGPVDVLVANHGVGR